MERSINIRRSRPVDIIVLSDGEEADTADPDVRILLPGEESWNFPPNKRRKLTQDERDEMNAGMLGWLPAEVFTRILNMTASKDAVSVSLTNRWMLRTVWAAAEHLDFRDCESAWISLLSAKRALFLTPRLQELHIRRNPLDSPLLAQVAERAHHTWTKLAVLDLKGCQNISDDILLHISRCTGLKRLDLSRTDVQVHSYRFLPSLTQLEELQIGYPVRTPPVGSPAPALQDHLTGLRTLGIAGWPPEPMIGWINRCTSLTALDFRNSSSVEVLECFLNRIVRFKELERIKVSRVGTAVAWRRRAPLAKLSIDCFADFFLIPAFNLLTSLTCPHISLPDLKYLVCLGELKVQVWLFLPEPVDSPCPSLRRLKCGSIWPRISQDGSFALGLAQTSYRPDGALSSCYIDNILIMSSRYFSNLVNLELINFEEDPKAPLEGWAPMVSKLPSLFSLRLVGGRISSDNLRAACRKFPNLIDFQAIRCVGIKSPLSDYTTSFIEQPKPIIL